MATEAPVRMKFDRKRSAQLRAVQHALHRPPLTNLVNSAVDDFITKVSRDPKVAAAVRAVRHLEVTP